MSIIARRAAVALVAGLALIATAVPADAHGVRSQASGTQTLTDIGVTIDTNQIQVGNNQPVQGRALDQRDDPIAGQKLTLTLTGSNTDRETVTTDKNGIAEFYPLLRHHGTITATVTGPGGTPKGTDSAYVKPLPVRTFISVRSPRKGIITVTCSTDQPGNFPINGQEMGFYQYIAHSPGYYRYLDDKRIDSYRLGAAQIAFARPSGELDGFRCRIVKDADLSSPFSLGRTARAQ